MPVLEVKNIKYGYSKGTPFAVTALDDVSFSAKKNELIGIIGHTGSGKSTLIQTLNALLIPDSGTVMLDGADINRDKKTRRDARFRVGLCFQYPEYQLFEETVEKDIAFGPKNMGLDEKEINSRVMRASLLVGLDKALLSKSPFDLSGGEKRRAAIAGIIAMDPEILILDEPTAGLDPRGRQLLLNTIVDYREKTGSTVILVSHSMEDVALVADKILVLSKGRTAMFGTPSEIFRREAELSQAGLSVPVATKLIRTLNSKGFQPPSDIYTAQAAADCIAASLKGGRAK